MLLRDDDYSSSGDLFSETSIFHGESGLEGRIDLFKWESLALPLSKISQDFLRLDRLLRSYVCELVLNMFLSDVDVCKRELDELKFKRAHVI